MIFEHFDEHVCFFQVNFYQSLNAHGHIVTTWTFLKKLAVQIMNVLFNVQQ